MTSRERLLTAFSKKEPDRVPVYAEFVPEVKAKLLNHFKTDDYYEMCVKIGNDMLMNGAGIAQSYYGEGETYVCKWGITWQYFTNSTGSYTEIIKHPLADDEDGKKLAAYEIPNPEGEDVYMPARKLVEKYGKTHFIGSAINCSIFEAAWYLHGLEDTVMDMAANEDYANALFDKVMEYPLRAGLRLIDEGVDLLWLGDDVGMQKCMMMSPEMWRKYLKPRMKKLITAFHEKNPKILVAYHSCGFIEPIIDDLAEIGLDVLNPIQPLAMDPAHLKEKYGDKLMFWGGICVQKTLPTGNEEDIRNEVSLRMKTIAKGGGYLMGPAHTIQSDTSLENIFAFYKAVFELGKY